MTVNIQAVMNSKASTDLINTFLNDANTLIRTNVMDINLKAVYHACRGGYQAQAMTHSPMGPLCPGPGTPASKF